MSPISVDVKPYNGRNPRLISRYHHDLEVARKLEQYLNDRYVEGEPRTFIYHYIARDLFLDVDTVRRLLFPVRCGSNGITI